MARPADPDNSSTDTDTQDVGNCSLREHATQVLADLLTRSQLRVLKPIAPEGKYVERDGRRLLNLASNDYLGLSTHPALIDAAVKATQQFGVGSGASRLVSGTQQIHAEAEQRFAAFKHAEAALLFPTGYTANLAVLTTLAGPGDLVVLDKLVHASLIDAARASGAEVRTFTHLNLERAEHLLTRDTAGRRLLVTDSVFSMDGDCADLPALCDLADRTNAALIVDEAHGTGVLGGDGSGLASAHGVAERVYTCGIGGVVISTASKAMGSLGGLVTASRPLIDLIINKARPFIYSTAVPPAQAASIIAAIEVIQSQPELRNRLAELSTSVRAKLVDRGWQVQPQVQGQVTPIIPLIVGSEQAALSLAAAMNDQGIYAPAIRPPTVAPGSARVRLSLRSDLCESEITKLFDAFDRYE